MKAKHLKKQGLIPCNVLMGRGQENLILTAHISDAMKLLKLQSVGSRLNLQLNGNSFLVLLKEIDFDGLGGQLNNLTFQLLVEDQYINSVAKIVITNKELVSGMVQILQPEIPYRALAKHMVETVEIDVGKLRRGEKVMLKDLAICSNPELELFIPPERLILTIAR